jgi:hypothetical protein
MQKAKPKQQTKRRVKLPSFGVALYPEWIERQMRTEKLTLRFTLWERRVLKKMADAFNTPITNVLSHLVVQAWENTSAAIRRARPDLFAESEETAQGPTGKLRPESVGKLKSR